MSYLYLINIFWYRSINQNIQNHKNVLLYCVQKKNLGPNKLNGIVPTKLSTNFSLISFTLSKCPLIILIKSPNSKKK